MHKVCCAAFLRLRRGDVPEHSQTRVFNNFKNELCDRQIGGQTCQEAKLYGPSRLSSRADLVDLRLDASSQTLRIYCADRSDFYHQFHMTDAKASADTAGPPILEDEVVKLPAYAEMLQLSS